jgi:hypothetical protein
MIMKEEKRMIINGGSWDDYDEGVEGRMIIKVGSREAFGLE